MGKVSRKLRQQGKELMYLPDSTSLTLKGREFDRWTLKNRTRNTQGMKLHVLYDAQGEIPVWHHLSAANVNDIERAAAVPLEANALDVFDKGDNDYNWWHSIDESGARFGTRFKRNASVNVEQKLDISDDAGGILARRRDRQPQEQTAWRPPDQSVPRQNTTPRYRGSARQRCAHRPRHQRL
jgi:putative transposase